MYIKIYIYVSDVGKNPPPTAAQLRYLAAHSAMPFIGFGFLDNLIMILAVSKH